MTMRELGPQDANKSGEEDVEHQVEDDKEKKGEEATDTSSAAQFVRDEATYSGGSDGRGDAQHNDGPFGGSSESRQVSTDNVGGG